MKLKLLLGSMFFLFSWSLFSQNWNQVITYDFNDIQNLSELPPEFILSGQQLNGFGASGQTNDKCLQDKFVPTSTKFVAYKFPLGPGLKCRFGWNAKSKINQPGRKLEFLYSSEQPVPGFPVQGTTLNTETIVNVNANQPGTNLLSTEFDVEESGLYYLIVKISNSTPTNNFSDIRIDDFKIEIKETIDNSASFSEESITINEGEDFNICVELAYPLTTNQYQPIKNVKVDLGSDWAPHFENFEAEILEFSPTTGTELCFVVVPNPNNGIQDDNYSYTFNLESLSPTLLITSPSTFTVKINDIGGSTKYVCEGECTEIGVEGITLDDSYCFKWTPEESIADGQSNQANPEVCPQENTLYQVEVIDIDGNIVGTSEVQVIVVEPETFLDNEKTICTEETATLEAGGGETYIWSTGDENFKIEVSPLETTSYSVTTTDVYGCTSSADVLVNVKTSPTLEIEGNTEVCDGQSTTLNLLTSTNNNPNQTYFWSTGETSTEITVSPSETTTYSVSISDDNGCIKSGSIEVDVVDLEVEIKSEPEAELICPGGTLKLDAGENFTSYSWGGSNNETTQEITINAPGTYTVTVTNQDGCEGEDEIEIKGSEDEEEFALTLKKYFEDKGFFSIDIEIIGDQAFSGDIDDSQRSTNTTLCDANSCDGTSSSNGCVNDDANLEISIDGHFIPFIENELKDNIDYFHSTFGYTNGRGFISKNENICECPNYLSIIESEFIGVSDGNNTEFNFWAHIWQNPIEGEPDQLFILANVPSDDKHSPNTKDHEEYIRAVLDNILESNETYGFANQGTRAFYAAIESLLDNDVGVLDKNLVKEVNELFDLGCESVVNEEAIIGLASSGIPIKLPTRTVIRFGVSDRFEGIIDPRALTGFTALVGSNEEPGVYRGRALHSTQEHFGYFLVGIRNDLASSLPYQSPGLTPDPESPLANSVKVRLGKRVDGDGGCKNFEIEDRYFQPNSGLNNSEDSGQGPITSSFEEMGQFGSLLSSSVYPVCLPPITPSQFQAAEENAQFNPFGENGILLKVTRPSGVIDYIWGVSPSFDPDDIEYFRYNCAIGLWSKFTPPNDSEEKIKMPVLVALYKSFVEAICGKWVQDLTSADIMFFIDVVGALPIPIVGEIADGINAVWYFSKGDVANGFISLSGILVPEIITLGVNAFQKYYVKFGDEIVQNTRAIGKIACVDGLGGNPDVSNLMLAPFLSCPLQNFDGSFNIRKILDKAKELDLSPSETKKLTEFLLDDKVKFIGRKMDDNPDLIKVWKQANLEDFPDTKRIDLFNFLDEAGEVAIQKFTTKPEMVKGWKFLDDIPSGVSANKKQDLALIESSTDFLEDANALSRIEVNGLSGKESLQKIIQKNNKAHCKNCNPPNQGRRHLTDIDEYLNNVRNFANNYTINSAGEPMEGAEYLIKLMQNGTDKQLSSIDQTVRLLKENGANPSSKFYPDNVKSLEIKLSNEIDEVGADNLTKNRGDIFAEIEINSSVKKKFYELKSYQKSSLDNLVGNKKQFKAYLGNTNLESLDDLEYIFDKRKLLREYYENLPSYNVATDASKYYDGIDKALNKVKRKFQLLFHNNDDIFQAIHSNPALRDQLELPLDEDLARQVFAGLVGNIQQQNVSSILYKFIKVE